MAAPSGTGSAFGQRYQHAVRYADRRQLANDLLQEAARGCTREAASDGATLAFPGQTAVAPVRGPGMSGNEPASG